MSNTRLRGITLLSIILLNLLFTPFSPMTWAASPQSDGQGVAAGASIFSPAPEGSNFVRQVVNGESLCREATSGETHILMERDPDIPMEEISPVRSNRLTPQAGGLRIILRGTPQLEAFPEAKAAFLRAAATWERLIQSPVTLVLDVDFGPTRFGQPYPQNVLGSTSSQIIGSASAYTDVRAALLEKASSAQETELYNLLPAAALPTDLGGTTGLNAPSAVFRALGIINPVADPDAEKGQLGPPPSVGFNSQFAYDFNPDDGIDRDKTDFTAVALHEIGHALGFVSSVGMRELSPSSPLRASIWDLFRFRPGVSPASFTAAPRILSSGGSQIFFAGGPELELSTGRGDATGGDGRQASHWKDDALTGQYIGIMDPTLSPGEQSEITEDDLMALDLMGYAVGQDAPPPPGSDNTPTIRELSATLAEDVLTLRGLAADADGDIAHAQVKLLDGAGQVVAHTEPFAVNLGTATTVAFTLTVTNLRAFPTALRACLTLIDRSEQTSPPVTADFSQADPGGPTVANATFNGAKMKIKGRSLSGQLAVEINGVVVAAGFNAATNKVIVKGGATTLYLRSGANRVRVRNGALWSNILILQL